MSLSRPLAPMRSRAGDTAASPSTSRVRPMYRPASATVRMPPEGLKPTRPRASARAAIAPSSTRAASGVALRAVLPVLVLRKSAPWSSAMRQAWAMRAASASSPVSRMTFSVRPSQARRTACSSAPAWAKSRYGKTTSTSCAPASTMAAVSRTARCTSGLPSGKLATAATRIAAGSCARACAASRGHTHTAATCP